MKNPQTEKTATACQKTPTWMDQARNAIRQGQSLNDFVSHCHIDNRRQARKAFLSARLAIIPNEQEREELLASVNHAKALAEALRDCATDTNALAFRNHAYAKRRLMAITDIVMEALARFGGG